MRTTMDSVYVYARFKPGIRVTEAPFLMVSSLETYATKIAVLTHVASFTNMV